MTPKDTFLKNLVGMKWLAFVAVLLFVAVPVLVGYMWASPRVSEDLAKLVVQLTFGLAAWLMGARSLSDVFGGVFRNGKNGNGNGEPQ